MPRSLIGCSLLVDRGDITMKTKIQTTIIRLLMSTDGSSDNHICTSVAVNDTNSPSSVDNKISTSVNVVQFVQRADAIMHPFTCELFC